MRFKYQIRITATLKVFSHLPPFPFLTSVSLALFLLPLWLEYALPSQVKLVALYLFIGFSASFYSQVPFTMPCRVAKVPFSARLQLGTKLLQNYKTIAEYQIV